MILALRTMPESSNPHPKMAPTMNVMSWSITISFSVILCDSAFIFTIPPQMGSSTPGARKKLAEQCGRSRAVGLDPDK